MRADMALALLEDLWAWCGWDRNEAAAGHNAAGQ
jgi:hypothetical protein